MRTQTLLLGAFLCLHASAQNKTDLDSIIIPRKTDIFVTLGRGINTKTAQVGDKFFGNVSVPVTIDDEIVIPVGSYLIGHVVESARAGRVKGRSQLRLTWDTLILPTGVTRRIEAVLTSAESQSTRRTDEDGKIEGGGSQGKEVAGGATKGAIGGSVTGVLVDTSWKGAGIGGAVGAGAGALLSLFQRGEDVALPKGTEITLQIESDIRFKPFQVKKSQSLKP